MDIRGIEVMNQLKSAIRAKLLELGVRYDEELPDYIIIMVVNKKSRAQMHEDLHLFLESYTTPFVDWLHDRVLKKLQKVTVAKKKTVREFVPTVVVKQEEEKKKKKTATSFLDDHEDPERKGVKEDKPVKQKPSQKDVQRNVDKGTKKSEDIPNNPVQLKKTQNESQKTTKEIMPESNVTVEPLADAKANEPKCLKRPLETASNYRETLEKKNEAKRSRTSEEKVDVSEDNSKKLKSCVNKPKITSVVSVKNRLGIVSPRKKFEVHREKQEIDSRYRVNEKRFDKNRFDSNRNNFQRRNFDEERSRRMREMDIKHPEPEKINDIKNRLGNAKDRTNKTAELREKVHSNLKAKVIEKVTGTIKDRLGITNAKPQKQPGSKAESDFKHAKAMEQDRDALNKNIKHRLGPLKNNFRPLGIKSGFNSVIRRSQSTDEEDCLNLGAEEELDEVSVGNGPIKSHIIAVNKPLIERKRLKPDKVIKEVSSDAEDEIEDAKIPSKVIVTPRPLKPLQPAQKRATQSLLLRAVAEANQSVVTQKNPEPSLVDKKPVKHLKPAPVRDVGQNLSVHLNSNKRLVMEKIQVELNTVDISDPEPKPYVPQPVTDEHMGVVMSLFQRSDDNQKFLVTLNGYNSSLAKEKPVSDDDERLEMEVNEDDELALLTNQVDTYNSSEEQTIFRLSDSDVETSVTHKESTDENNENCNTENVHITDETPRKRRKLSPIVYNRSHSPSPAELKSATLSNSPTKRVDKKPLTENAVTVIDKSREKCRYWPNCTLGNKCAYLHPPVLCSAFPACKFGDKCAYRHPKCKFGLSCTKLGCVFSHPAQQCKYHPFCTKPSCPFSHPAQHPLETTQRAKFTWRRRE